MSDQKKKLEEDQKIVIKEEKYTVENYKEFQRTLRLMNGPEEKKTEQKKTEQKKTEQKKTEQKTRQKPQTPGERSPEDIFNLRPGQTFTQSELKKRYLELIKENHPDKVASMGADFKKLAEKNTKDINQAFDTLKKKAS